LTLAAGVQNPKPALEYPVNEVKQMLDVNYTGVFVAARACANEMYRYKVKDGSICLVASMSGSIANKGLITPVYNSSKGAVVQLARSLAMEWGRTRSDKSGGIRVNSLSPGHIRTPMVNKNFEDGDLSEPDIAERAMLGRISEPEEFKATGLFLMSKASSFIVSLQPPCLDNLEEF
jgi:D-arabinitol 2-dehydrogenase